MKRLLACAALVWLAASRAAGQEGGAPAPPLARPGDASAEAGRLLGSRADRERAWGAYLAGAYDLKEHAPLLVGLLGDAEGAAGGREDEPAVRRAALDALIRLDAEVPAETLLPLYELAPDEVVILLARAPERNAAALLPLFSGEAPDARWLALGNLLAEARARGFATRLLAGLKVMATVHVYDREGAHGYNGGGGGGCGGDRLFAPTPEGFPPFGRYALTATPRRGAAVVARGRHTVFYVRADAARGLTSDASCEVERDAYRVEYLADLLGTTGEDLGLEARPSHEIVCRDARQCRRALSALRDEEAGAYARVLERLDGAGLLEPDEAAGLEPDLTFNLYDQRDRRAFALPAKLAGVRIHLVGGAADAEDDGRQ